MMEANRIRAWFARLTWKDARAYLIALLVVVVAGAAVWRLLHPPGRYQLRAHEIFEAPSGIVADVVFDTCTGQIHRAEIPGK